MCTSTAAKPARSKAAAISAMAGRDALLAQDRDLGRRTGGNERAATSSSAGSKSG